MKKICWCWFLTLLFGLSQISAFYPQYREYPNHKIQGDGSYLYFTNKIDKNEIKTIFEIGSRDAKDAISLSYFYHCHVFSFECNPTALEMCKKNIGFNPNVTLIPSGVWDKTGEISFYSISEGNIGAASFLPFNPKARNYPTIVKDGLVQKKITVSAVRLDEFLKAREIGNIDLLCMDVQGASFQVLSSLGDQLSKVKYIIVELETHPIYSGEILYNEVDKFLAQAGFIRASEALDQNGLFGDVLYINTSLKQRKEPFKAHQ